jgi:hypothetical protein
MANQSKIFACEKGHKILSNVKNEKRLLSGKVVCGSCGTVFQEYKSPSWSGQKHFLCEVGHVITICPFGNGQCNLSWGDREGEFINLKHHPDEMSEMLANNEILCPAGDGKKSCGTHLTALEGTVLTIPQLMGVKTRTRVGDVWDKYKCPEPKAGSYDKDMNFRNTQFSKLNKERVKRLKEKRNTRPAGEVVDKATQRQNRGDPKPDKSDL